MEGGAEAEESSVKPISDDVLDELEDTARQGAKKIREYFKYEGDNGSFYQKAKVGATVIAGWSRVRSSETNRMQIEMKAEKADK